ncbi:MAG TPA: hypothetical protein VK638_16110 [Edaphobacter sp.]|nr:hypothetical protein [Edaphobacter sp.]
MTAWRQRFKSQFYFKIQPTAPSKTLPAWASMFLRRTSWLMMRFHRRSGQSRHFDEIADAGSRVDWGRYYLVARNANGDGFLNHI